MPRLPGIQALTALMPCILAFASRKQKTAKKWAAHFFILIHRLLTQFCKPRYNIFKERCFLKQKSGEKFIVIQFTLSLLKYD
jgi:hypothetical protein